MARKIAERIVAGVNMDDCYWTPDELPDRIADVSEEIVAHGNPATVMERLYRKQPPINDRGERGGEPWGWEGINSHCYAIGSEIAREEVAKAVEEWRRTYEP